MDATGTRPWRVRTFLGYTRKRACDSLAHVHTLGAVLRLAEAPGRVKGRTASDKVGDKDSNLKL
jgi:hypothetical protein